MGEDIWNTLIVTLGTIVVAVVTVFGGKRAIETRKRKRLREVDQNESEAVEQFTNDPGGWVRDVLASNRDLVARVEAAEAKADRVQSKADELQAAFDAFREKDRKFRNALARWMNRIVDAWGVAETMPYPDAGDHDILADVIPSALEATQPRRPPKPTTP